MKKYRNRSLKHIIVNIGHMYHDVVLVQQMLESMGAGLTPELAYSNLTEEVNEFIEASTIVDYGSTFVSPSDYGHLMKEYIDVIRTYLDLIYIEYHNANRQQLLFYAGIPSIELFGRNIKVKDFIILITESLINKLSLFYNSINRSDANYDEIILNAWNKVLINNQQKYSKPEFNENGKIIKPKNFKYLDEMSLLS